jgi:hypothetical protein
MLFLLEKIWHTRAGRNSLIARVEADTPVRIHQEIELVCDLERMHLFDKEPPHQRFGT